MTATQSYLYCFTNARRDSWDRGLRFPDGRVRKMAARGRRSHRDWLVRGYLGVSVHRCRGSAIERNVRRGETRGEKGKRSDPITTLSTAGPSFRLEVKMINPGGASIATQILARLITLRALRHFATMDNAGSSDLCWLLTRVSSFRSTARRRGGR